MSQVLIAGLGDVGQQLARVLVKAGHQVWGIKRKPMPDFETATPCPLVLADLTKPETLVDLPEDIDFVVYCPTPDERTESAYRNIFVNGLTHLLSALHGQHIKRVFYVSSTGVYGQRQGEWVDEQSETLPERFSGRVLLEAEKFLQQQAVPATVIRLAGIYGPGRHHLLKSILSGRSTSKSEPAEAYTNRIHRDDAARMIHFLLEQDNKNKTVAGVYIGVDDKPCSKHEITTWLFQQLCNKFGSQSVPPLQQSVDHKQTSINQNKRCSNQKIKTAGFEFKYTDYQSGYQAVLNQIKSLQELV